MCLRANNQWMNANEMNKKEENNDIQKSKGKRRRIMWLDGFKYNYLYIHNIQGLFGVVILAAL